MNKVKADNKEITNSSTQENTDIPIGDYYKLNSKKKLGSGAFGEIYKGLNTKLNEEVAIKLEPIKTQHPQLFYESKLYSAFKGGGTYTLI